MSKMTEVLKKENNELNIIIDKLKFETEREINRRDIEINDLKRYVLSMKRSPKKDKHKSTMVLDYKEITRDLDKDKDQILQNIHELTH